MSPYTGLRALAMSRHNKVKTFSKEGELIIVERIRDALALTTYLLYPFGPTATQEYEEGMVCDKLPILEHALACEGSPITFGEKAWYPLEYC